LAICQTSLVGTIDHGLLLHQQPSSFLKALSNASWGADPDDRKSTTGFCIYFDTNLISWSTHKQEIVSRSNREVEYKVVAVVMTEILWLKSLLHELHIQTPDPQIFSNNLDPVFLRENPVMHSKYKHFELDLHFVRDNVQNHLVQLVHIPGRFQVVDPLTNLVFDPTFIRVKHTLKVAPNRTMSLRGC